MTRTQIIADVVHALDHLQGLQEALTRATAALEDRRGPEAADALTQVDAARQIIYDRPLQAALETALNRVARMP